MFLGHFAVGMAAKRAAPKTSLATLFAAAEFADLLWPVLLLTGIEHVRIDPGNTAATPLDFYDYPISHSFVTGIGWAVGFALVYWAIRSYGRGAWILGGCVISHWVLDVISHRPDVPLYPGGHTYLGLGLWNSVPATLIVEFGMFIAGVAIYAGFTTPRDRIGRYAFWALAVTLAIVYLASLLGPPPPSVHALALVSLAGWVFLLWAWWADSHRRPASDQ